VTDYDSHSITKKGNIIPSYHFEDRLFDRDTLFVHQYKINFLYVLKSYTTFNSNEITTFRKEVKETFRNNFLKFFNDSTECKFEFFESTLEKEKYSDFVENNFRKLNGKCYCTIDNRLILAKHIEDASLDSLLVNFIKTGDLE